MLHHHGRVALNGVEILFLEAVAGLRWCEKFSRQRDGAAGIRFGDPLIARQSFVDAHDKFGNVVQPRELRAIHHQAKQFACADDAMRLLVIAPLHIQQGFMQTQQRLPEGDKFLAGRGVAPVALICVRIFRLSQDYFSLTILRQFRTAG